MKRSHAIKNTHLIISSVVVLPVSLIYGFAPEVFFKLTVSTIDEQNILKAIMGIYIAFAILWVLGICNSKYWKIATVSNFIFMFGLAFGRIISMLFDGIPSPLLLFGVTGELILGVYGIYIYQQNSTEKTT
ncbi:DUF4345 domain-containing protein [Flavobacterium amnicola]|jgi:hypothetical protein|uniref:DUF4345 domain-containing protein n=1 Tax=Flavobacterium amnicola TaxID=2506422 RepID=A0A4V1N252_9FLAO|nr:DUF4345 domain-containing protein [Flavobacterium amnicola]RXR20511.1 DUF4345 domain-containing protein [Flavobacterium amnicola]